MHSPSRGGVLAHMRAATEAERKWPASLRFLFAFSIAVVLWTALAILLEKVI